MIQIPTQAQVDPRDLLSRAGPVLERGGRACG